MKISIILPIYNVAEYLERSLNSIMNQTYENWECFLINDGSTDISREICESFIEKDNRFKLYNQKNSGSGVARNNGLKRASGDYICFIDPDDFISHDALTQNVDIALNFKPDVIVNGYLEINSKYSKPMIPKITGFLKQEEFRGNFRDYSEIGANSLWNKLYRQEFLTKHNITFTSQRTGQDSVFNYNVYKLLDNIYIDDHIYYNYDRSREGSAVNTFNEERIEHEKNILSSYINMIEYWELEDQYSNEITKKKWTVIYHYIRNINLPNNPYTWNDKIKIIKKIRNNSEFKKIRQSLTTNMIASRISRYIYILLDYKMYRLLLLMIKIYIKSMK